MTTKTSKKNPAPEWGGDMLAERYDALLLANGTPPLGKWFPTLRQRCGKIIALDGGLNVLRRWAAVPDHVIGDLDSATGSALAWAKSHGAAIHPRPSQESADLQKGFSLCHQLRLKSILLAGADGDALDHVLNAFSVTSASRGLDITFITRRVVARVIRGRARLTWRVPRNHTVSWFGCPAAGPCSLEGVVWPFKDRMIRMGEFNSLSNLPAGNEITLRQASGTSLFVVSLRPKATKSLILTD